MPACCALVSYSWPVFVGIISHCSWVWLWRAGVAFKCIFNLVGLLLNVRTQGYRTVSKSTFVCLHFIHYYHYTAARVRLHQVLLDMFFKVLLSQWCQNIWKNSLHIWKTLWKGRFILIRLLCTCFAEYVSMSLHTSHIPLFIVNNNSKALFRDREMILSDCPNRPHINNLALTKVRFGEEN